VHTLLVYLDQDEIVLVTLQPEFTSRDANGVVRRLAYVERRLQSFPNLRPPDLPPDVVTLDVQPARADCRYVCVDDEGLRLLRALELARAAEIALDGASPQEAARDMQAAIAAIPAFVVAERERLSAARANGEDPFGAWSSPEALALLAESHADLAARIRAASQVLAQHPSPTAPPEAETRRNDAPGGDDPPPSGIWRRRYDRPPMS
jgi:hypothetical protein